MSGDRACARVASLPSRSLIFVDGLWQSRSIGSVSYPQDGNGFVSMAMQAAGHEAVLVEPGTGAFNALLRGVKTVVRSTLTDAAFDAASIDAVGVFDVVEHVEDDEGFLAEIRRVLKSKGRVYCTVPAMPALWSDEDVDAGHYRRYTAHSLTGAMHAAGLRVEFISALFGWLVAPLFTMRTVPYLCGRRRHPATHGAATRSDHTMRPWLRGLVDVVNRRELSRLSRGVPARWGTSLICVACRP